MHIQLAQTKVGSFYVQEVLTLYHYYTINVYCLGIMGIVSIMGIVGIMGIVSIMGILLGSGLGLGLQ